MEHLILLLLWIMSLDFFYLIFCLFVCLLCNICTYHFSYTTSSSSLSFASPLCSFSYMLLRVFCRELK